MTPHPGPAGPGPNGSRVPLLGSIAAAIAVAWGYLAWLVVDMERMAGGTSTPAPDMLRMLEAMPRPWSSVDAVAMLVMWWVMMVGMMLPSATPMLLTVSAVNRKRRERGRPAVGTVVFAAGYLLAWGGYGVAATTAQWGLERAALLSPMMAGTSPVFGGLLLIAAGVYQFTPLKHACLAHCRSPLSFIINRWRDGAGGALRMGLEHGGYCLGCCWALMALLFVFGVMNLLWVAGLTVIVLLEKAAPGGEAIARMGGLAMLGAGIAMLAGLV